MNLDKYEIETEVNSTYFEFVSKGTHGSIVKVIKYSKIFEVEEIYNLGFRDKNLTSSKLDDKIISNNGDTDKVLATVASTMHEFFNENPNAIVCSKGSSTRRTRLYQINISKYLDEIVTEFEVFGELEDKIERFKKRINYLGFYVIRHK